MSADRAHVATGAATKPGAGRSPRVEQLLLLALVVLSGIGIAVSHASSDRGYRYWLAMVPVFGVLSAVATGSAAQRRGAAVGPAVGREVLHWTGLAVAVYLIYLLQSKDRITQEAAGTVALVALALTSYLAGIHGNWRFGIVGAILGSAVAVAVLVADYLWLLTVPLLVGAIAGAFFWMRRPGADPGSGGAGS